MGRLVLGNRQINPAYSPTLQTRLIAALNSLTGRDGRADFVARAAMADSEERAQFFEETAELMVIFDRTHATVERLLSEAGATGVLASGHRIVELLPFDFVVWTEDFTNHADRITRYAATSSPRSPREIWSTGKLSERTRRELRKRGWTTRANKSRLREQPGGPHGRKPLPPKSRGRCPGPRRGWAQPV